MRRAGVAADKNGTDRIKPPVAALLHHMPAFGMDVADNFIPAAIEATMISRVVRMTLFRSRVPNSRVHREIAV